ANRTTCSIRNRPAPMAWASPNSHGSTSMAQAPCWLGSHPLAGPFARFMPISVSTGLSVPAGRVPVMAMNSSAEEPQPLGRVVMAVKDWVGRLGEIWVDAQVIEIKRRSGPTQFLTFRDRIADVSASVTASALVLDAAGPLPEGSRVTARLRPRLWDRNSSLSFECLEI